MEGGQISKDSITASSQRSPVNAPENGRLHFHKGDWMPHISDHSQWLQVDFGNDTQVTGISTQGHHFARLWVKSFSMRYSKDGSYFEVYQLGQHTKVKKCHAV